MTRDVIVLGVIAFFVMVGFGVVIPVLPVYARSFGIGHVEVGLVISAFALMRLLASPFCARMIEFAGERIVLSAGIGIVALSSGLVAIAQDYPQLLLLRAAGGIGSAMFSVSAMTLLLHTTAPSLRGRAVGFYQGGFLIGGMAGPALGAVLATVSLTAPFLFYAGTLTVAGAIGLALLRSPKHQEGGDAPATEPIRLGEVVRDIRFRVACLANFSQGWTSFGVRGALVPLLIVEVLRGPSSYTGIAFALAAVTQTIALVPASRYVDLVGRKSAIVGASLVAGAVMIAVPFAPNIWVLTALLCVYGVTTAFLGTAPAAVVGDVAPGRAGRPVAAFSMVSDFGAIIGPIVAGVLVDLGSYPAAFATGGALLIITALYATRMRDDRTPAAPDVAAHERAA